MTTEPTPSPSRKKFIVTTQSNYIPWKGYFDLIQQANELILYDSMQFTRRDWRNRNLIKTGKGLHWLTIPVKVKGKYFQKINETQIDGNSWAHKHWRSIAHAYAKSPFFSDLAPTFEKLYKQASQLDLLSQVNHLFICKLCEILGIHTQITWDTNYPDSHGKTERLINICLAANGTDYISGPAAKSYIQPDLFQKAGIALHWMDYSSYPEYHQLHPPFQHSVSILDLLFNTGPHAPNYLNSRNQPCPLTPSTPASANTTPIKSAPMAQPHVALTGTPRKANTSASNNS